MKVAGFYDTRDRFIRFGHDGHIGRHLVGITPVTGRGTLALSMIIEGIWQRSTISVSVGLSGLDEGSCQSCQPRIPARILKSYVAVIPAKVVQEYS